jgi:sugar lactone lactonase YvrE
MAPRDLAVHIQFEAAKGIPDGQGGYYLTGYEPFDDGRTHYSVFWVDGAGSARRLACDPGAEIIAYSNQSAVSPDALYLPVTHTDGWTIVKIPRTAQKPRGSGPT